MTSVSATALVSYTGEHRKELKELYNQRNGQLLRHHTAHDFLTDDYWQSYVSDLLARLAKANPGFVDADARAHILRDGAVNAACYGEGTVSVNLGMLVRLRSDDELAFVLSHELAHQYLRHLDDHLRGYVDRLYAKQTQQDLRQLQRTGTYAEVEAFAKTFAFEASRHSRYGESAADSLGLTLFLAAGFDPVAPLRVMEVLAKADTSAYATALPITELLSTPELRFRKQYLVKPTELFASSESMSEAERDSLATHPDTESRRADLERWCPSCQSARSSALMLADGSEQAIGGDRIPELLAEVSALDTVNRNYAERRAAAKRELAAAHFTRGNLGASLYAALRLIEAGDTTWARGLAALSLYRLALARENNRMTLHARLPRHRTSDEGYESLLRGLHEMRRRELADLALAYAKYYAAAQPEVPELQLARALVAGLEADPNTPEPRQLARDFRERFKSTPYAALLGGEPDPWLPKP